MPVLPGALPTTPAPSCWGHAHPQQRLSVPSQTSSLINLTVDQGSGGLPGLCSIVGVLMAPQGLALITLVLIHLPLYLALWPTSRLLPLAELCLPITLTNPWVLLILFSLFTVLT